MSSIPSHTPVNPPPNTPRHSAVMLTTDSHRHLVPSLHTHQNHASSSSHSHPSQPPAPTLPREPPDPKNLASRISNPGLDPGANAIQATRNRKEDSKETKGMGAGKKKFTRTFKELCSNWKPEITVIMEPRLSGPKAERVIKRLRFSNTHRVEARGFAGGIWLLWNELRTSVEILFNHNQFVHARVSGGAGSFLFTAIYASPQDKWRRFLWQNIEILAAQSTEPWLLMGDFNAVLAGHERKDQFGRQGLANKAFRCCVSDAGLLDLGFSGTRFTWKRGSYQSRLDRALCNGAWRTAFPNAEVRHLPYTCSDHCPLLVKNNISPPKTSRPFRFQAAWLSHTGSGVEQKHFWEHSPKKEEAAS
ncbi:hypothetical protein Tsubulata_044963 [Turnera subulata]|uniref:Endonuclease/exonuclease/phosphatase domain-containing protein n=1 Tax=Turnera subulata TaxID=218843 RepID=A0A9Q0JLQ6_9ROSI|nr:hypothetical protein Tsubulata_044963 [Turnera subulata]